MHHIQEWAALLVRWAHFITGIMWIGTSFYFVWLDSAFEKLPEQNKGIDGETWMVHGGNFYHVEKRKFGPGEMPKNLHWFIWEATLTWASGFVLLILVYYLTNGIYLVDDQVLKLSQGAATFIGLSAIFLTWFLYDFLFRLPIKNFKLLNVSALVLAGFLIYGLTHIFSGRGAFMHLGAMFGTMMVLNVWVHILPNQRAIIAASDAGQAPNYDLGVKAKKRSMHNSYMTLPVLLIMISNHFSFLYGNAQNWIVLILILIMGAFLRHTMITAKWKFLGPSVLSFAILFWMTSTGAEKNEASESSAPAQAGIHFYQVNHIIHQRCIQCHSQFATDSDFKVAPNGVAFDSPAQIQKFSEKIFERTNVQKNMPLANKTMMTESERLMLGAWVKEGAKIQ